MNPLPVRSFRIFVGAVSLVAALRAQTPPTYAGRDPAASGRCLDGDLAPGGAG